MTKLAVGQRVLDRYEVRGYLGAGGMAEVYLAKDARTGVEVAVKVLLHAFEPELVARFRAEARALAAVSHPSVVRLLDFGDVGGELPCMVMEKLDGEDLEKHLGARGPMPWREALPLVIDMLEGLDAIHQAGLVHRDIKPSNVFLEPRPRRLHAKLLDLGIAKDSAAPKLTRTGNTVGTPAYMAPEQLFGGREKVGPDTDVYQVGMVLFEMLSGTMPFPCADMGDLWLRCSRPPARLADAGVPEGERFDPLLARVLSRHRHERPPSALDFIASLEALKRGSERPRWESEGRQKVSDGPEAHAATLPPPADASPEPSAGAATLTALVARLPASRLARTDERRWVASQLPEGVRSFRVGAEVLLVLGPASSPFVEPLVEALRARFGAKVPFAARALPPGFAVSLAQLSGAAAMPSEITQLVASVL